MAGDNNLNTDQGQLLLCLCADCDHARQDVNQAVRERLRQAQADVLVVEDLCGLCARRDERLTRLDGTRVTAAACSGRAVRWLLAYAGITPASLEVVNLRKVDADEASRRLLDQDPTDAAAAIEPSPPLPAEAPPAPGADEAWPPWFPVIERDRCVDCGQCMSFCLFGVYAPSLDGKVVVAKPANCKNHCPACARVCPHGAIIFPKHGQAPIDGEEPLPGQSATATVDLDALLGDGQDVYARLRPAGIG